jgi:DNA/RNA endonuclease G, NUC1
MARRRRSSSRSRTRRWPLPARWLVYLNVAVALLLGGWYFAQPAERQQEVRRLVEAAMARDKNVSPLDVAWDVWQLYYANPAAGRIAPGDKTHLYGGTPLPTGAAGTAAPRVLMNQAYVVGYSEVRRNPVWAAYRVGDLAEIPTPPPRPEKFVADARTAARVTPDAYTGSGYDRGHLAPNYAIATRYGAGAQEETFLMSNIVPQQHSLNAGLWRELERKIATSYPARYEEVWVLTGPVFGADPRELRGGVQIPEAFYLIVVDEHEGKLRVLAFLVPQSAAPSDDPARYLVSIDEIEERTGLDFLRELDDETETEIERARAARVW